MKTKFYKFAFPFGICLGLILLIIFFFKSIYVVSSPSLGTVRLNIETYLAGKNQPTHPSVYSFCEPWNGYRYWMAYSPYPNGNGEEENPCIAVSNDLYYWETPNFLANPIADNEETGCNELKDPHIVYREDLDRLEVWYLGRVSKHLGGNGASLLLMRKYSTDGVSWSEVEIMSETHYLSPSIIWDGEKYQMWAIGYDLYGTTGTISYQESQDGTHWTKPVLCTLGTENSNIDIWHGSVTVYDGTYYMSFIDNGGMQKIFCCTSNDGVQFSEPEKIIENSGFWRNLYRPFLWYDGADYVCIYGVVTTANQWYLSMSNGTSLSSLTGITSNDSTHMYPLADTPTNTHSITYQLKTVYDSVKSYLRIELLLLGLIEILLMFMCPKLYSSKKYFAICLIGNFIFCVYWIIIRMRLSGTFHMITAMISILILVASISAFIRCVQLSHKH